MQTDALYFHALGDNLSCMTHTKAARPFSTWYCHVNYLNHLNHLSQDPFTSARTQMSWLRIHGGQYCFSFKELRQIVYRVCPQRCWAKKIWLDINAVGSYETTEYSNWEKSWQVCTNFYLIYISFSLRYHFISIIPSNYKKKKSSLLIGCTGEYDVFVALF